jgi:peptide methionine sulfoxide reductase MsrA
MSEVSYSTIKEGETGKLISVSIPYDPSSLSTEEQIALARQIHDDIQRNLQKWFDEEIAREIWR